MFLKLRVLLAVLTYATLLQRSAVLGCRSEVCRRRRDVTQSEVLLHLTGCSGLTKPWLRQVSFCLGKNTAEIAIFIKSWYQQTYQQCFASCAEVKRGTKDLNNIEGCVLCFTSNLQGRGILETQNVTKDRLDHCIRQYVYASLSNELPSFQASSNSRGKIKLPANRPANDWWSITVKLPCKPPLFQFWDAYCINSFANDARARDFVLAQNKLIVSDEIQFLVRFSDACRFDLKDIQIIWSESVPAFALPQLSSFRGRSPRKQRGNIYFDSRAIAGLERADGGVPAELVSPVPGPRRKRQVPSEELKDMVARQFTRLGLVMPCTIDDLKVTDAIGLPVSVKSNRKKHLLDTSTLWTDVNGKPQVIRDISLLNMTMDYGRSGCFFGPSETKVVVNPPEGWLDSDRLVTCHTCHNAQSEEECNRDGKKVLCHLGEICQSETRQITYNKVSIIKSCKQAAACENNFLNNQKLQCRPGQATSVCRCCCDHDLCNKESQHCT